MVICFVGEMMENDFSKSCHRLRPSTAQTQHKAGSIVENACGKDQKNILLITLNFFQVTTLHDSVQLKAGLILGKACGKDQKKLLIIQFFSK